jgi:hypothetical protein
MSPLNCSHHYCSHCGRHHASWAEDDNESFCNGRCTEEGRRRVELGRRLRDRMISAEPTEK